MLNVIDRECHTWQEQGAETLLDSHHVTCVPMLCSVQWVQVPVSTWFPWQRVIIQCFCNYLCINTLVMYSHSLPMVTSVTIVKTYSLWLPNINYIHSWLICTSFGETIDKVNISIWSDLRYATYKLVCTGSKEYAVAAVLQWILNCMWLLPSVDPSHTVCMYLLIHGTQLQQWFTYTVYTNASVSNTGFHGCHVHNFTFPHFLYQWWYYVCAWCHILLTRTLLR